MEYCIVRTYKIRPFQFFGAYDLYVSTAAALVVGTAAAVDIAEITSGSDVGILCRVNCQRWLQGGERFRQSLSNTPGIKPVVVDGVSGHWHWRDDSHTVCGTLTGTGPPHINQCDDNEDNGSDDNFIIFHFSLYYTARKKNFMVLEDPKTFFLLL